MYIVITNVIKIHKQLTIATEKSNNFESVGFTGVPNCIQYPDIPTCPKSKKTMKFLCQLTDALEVKTK